MDESKLRWRTNVGRCPPELVGTDRRVFVRLRCGLQPRDPDGTPQTWQADAAKGQKTRWTLTDHPFDIVKWSIAE